MKTPSMALLISGLIALDAATASSLENNLPIVLSPSRMAQNISESPSAVTVIDRETIRATGARKILDVLRLVPGFVVGSHYGYTHSGTYHGLGDEYSRRIQVLVDGRSTWIPAYGGVSWLNLPVPIEDVDRIEVIRGPNAATYGSSAFLATVNILTRHASETVGTRAAVTAGSGQIQDQYLHHGGGRGDLAYSLSVSRQHDTGFDTLADTRQDDLLFARADYALSARDELTLEIGLSDSTYQVGRKDALTPDYDIGQQDSFQYLIWTRALSGGEDLRVTLSRNHFTNSQAFIYGPVPFIGELLFDLDYQTTRTDLELQHTLMPSAKTRAVWGAGMRRDEGHSEGYLDTDEAITNTLYRLFGHLEYRLSPKTLLNLGAMLEVAKEIEPEISPRAALIHHLSDAHTVRLAVSTGTRLPSMVEDFGAHRPWNVDRTLQIDKLVTAGDLDPERIVSHEIGYLYQPHGGLSVDLRFYYDRITNLINEYFRPVSPDRIGAYNNFTETLDFYNQDLFTATGFEVGSTLRLSGRDRLMLSYAYTQLDATEPANEFSYDGGAPTHQVAALWTHHWGYGFDSSVIYSWQNEMQWVAETPIESYDRLDIRLAKALGRGVRLELVGQNLSGAYADYRNEAVWDQIVFARVVADF